MSLLACLLAPARGADEATPALRPVAVWTTNPFEVRITFDRAMAEPPKDTWASIVLEVDATNANPSHVVADPGQRGLAEADSAARGQLRVVSAQLARDHRTLVLLTDPHPFREMYHLTWPGIRAAKRAPPGTLRLDYDLRGVRASWSSGQKQPPAWLGWLPGLEVEKSLARLTGSTEGDQFAKLLRRPGRLQLRTLVQPPASARVVRFESAQAFEISVDDRPGPRPHVESGLNIAELGLTPGDAYQSLVITLPTGPKTEAPLLRLSFVQPQHIGGNGEASGRPQAESRDVSLFWVPWVPPLPPRPAPQPAAPNPSGGDYARGKALFEGNQLKCASCHRLRGEGAQLGPDLTEQYRREPAAVLDDIINPSDRLNPNFVCFNLALREGVDLTAFVRLLDTQRVALVESDGKTNVVRRSELASLRPSAISMMPSGLLDTMTRDQIRDLLVFLLRPPQAVQGDGTAR